MIQANKAFLAAVLVLAGCAPKLTPSGNPDAGSRDAGELADGAIPSVSGMFTHEVDDNGVVTTTVDATSLEVWQYLDLETGRAVMPEDSFASTEWDLAFQRFYVSANGGISGIGGAAGARLPGANFDDVTEPPETGWIVDSPDTELDDDTGIDTAWNGGERNVNDWYDYALTGHRLMPRDVVFVVRSVEGNFFKMQLFEYYSSVGTPAIIQFRWARIGGGEVEIPDAGPVMRPDAGMGTDAGPSIVIPEDALTIDASSRDGFAYVRVGEGVVTITDRDSDEWDLAFQRALVQTNSGTSGPGLGGARDGGMVELDSVTSADTVGFVVDEIEDDSMAGSTTSSTNPAIGSWFNYNFSTHTVTAKPIVWIVRTARGGYAAVRFWTWDEGVFRVSVRPIEAAPREHTITVDASGDAWARVNLATASAAEDDGAWDLAVRGALFQTNSGTSGDGDGGAIDTLEADASAVTSVPSAGFVVDDERLVPGGSGSYSGNGALEGWFDGSVEAPTPRATTYVVRLADGSAGRLTIADFRAGQYTLRWTYAGLGRTAF